ncbi:DUF2461 family protein, partial [Nonomuraea sp. NPDC055795]
VIGHGEKSRRIGKFRLILALHGVIKAELMRGPAGARLLTIVSALESEGFAISGQTLKKAPRGHAQDHPHIRLLRHTSLTATWRWPAPLWLNDPGAADLITGAWERAAPLSGWLRHHSPLED